MSLTHLWLCLKASLPEAHAHAHVHTHMQTAHVYFVLVLMPMERNDCMHSSVDVFAFQCLVSATGSWLCFFRAMSLVSPLVLNT